MAKNKTKKPDAKKKGKANSKAEDRRHPHLEHLDRIGLLIKTVKDPDTKKKARKEAEAELARLRAEGEKLDKKRPKPEPIDYDELAEERAAKADEKKKATKEPKPPIVEDSPDLVEEVDKVKARVKAKRLLRATFPLGIDGDHQLQPTDIDRSDRALVEAYNLVIGVETGHYLTSEGEMAESDIKLEAPVEKTPEVEEVATETGREFVAGEAKTEETTVVQENVPDIKDLEDPNVNWDDELKLPVNGRKSPMVWSDEAKKLVPYSRVTTFIDVLEDKTNISDWKVRTAIAGVALDGNLSEPENPLVHRADIAATTYESALKEIAKLDKKGKLLPGEAGDKEEAAEKAYKSEMRLIAEEALSIGGAHTKAARGTWIHELTAIYDEQGPDALREVEGVTESDLADVGAYVEAMRAIGITRDEVLDIERRVIVDEHLVTGTFDRGVKYKPEGAARAVKVIADLKTGRVDYGAGKIAMQIAEYAQGKGYDAETHERTNLGYSKKIGLLIHLPAGTATCTIYEVDLTKGYEGLKLAVLVKAWRQSTTEARSYRGATPYYTKLGGDAA